MDLFRLRFVSRLDVNNLKPEGSQQPVTYQVGPFSGKYAFGMELYAFYRVFTMAHTHDYPVRCCGGNFKHIRDGIMSEHERVIPCCDEILRDVFKYGFMVVMNN